MKLVIKYIVFLVFLNTYSLYPSSLPPDEGTFVSEEKLELRREILSHYIVSHYCLLELLGSQKENLILLKDIVFDKNEGFYSLCHRVRSRVALYSNNYLTEAVDAYDHVGEESLSDLKIVFESLRSNNELEKLDSVSFMYYLYLSYKQLLKLKEKGVGR